MVSKWPEEAPWVWHRSRSRPGQRFEGTYAAFSFEWVLTMPTGEAEAFTHKHPQSVSIPSIAHVISKIERNHVGNDVPSSIFLSGEGAVHGGAHDLRSKGSALLGMVGMSFR